MYFQCLLRLIHSTVGAGSGGAGFDFFFAFFFFFFAVVDCGGGGEAGTTSGSSGADMMAGTKRKEQSFLPNREICVAIFPRPEYHT